MQMALVRFIIQNNTNYPLKKFRHTLNTWFSQISIDVNNPKTYIIFEIDQKNTNLVLFIDLLQILFFMK